MRNQPLPDVEALLPAVVNAVATGPANTAELAERVAVQACIDIRMPESRRAVQSRVQRAVRCLWMAGLITINTKRPPQLTTNGRDALQERRKIDFAYLRASENFRKFEAGLRTRARVGRQRALDQLPREERQRIVDKDSHKSIYATRVTDVVRGGAPGLGKKSK